MSQFEELKHALEQNNRTSPKFTKEYRQINFFLQDLRYAPYIAPFSLALDQIDLEQDDDFFANGRFKYSDYSLSYEKEENAKFPTLYLTNILYSHRKKVIDIPHEYQVALLPLLSQFAKRYLDFLTDSFKSQ